MPERSGLSEGGGARAAAVIPALNESASIAAVVEAVRQFADPIVVDDGSTDGTGELAARAGALVVRHERNQGYDRALDSGVGKAVSLGYPYVVTLDADGQHDPERVRAFVTELTRGADVVVGRRPATQRISERIFAAVGRRLWGIEDPLCGMKAYRREVYVRVGHFDSYRSIGTELLIRALRGGCKVVQLPVQTRQRVGRPRFGAGLKANYVILRALAVGLVRATAVRD